METKFGDKLKELREKHFPGESLRNVGKRFETEFGEYFYTQLSKMETGVLLPSADFLSRIAKSYQLLPEEVAALVEAYTTQKIQSLNIVVKHHELAVGKLFRKVKKK